MKRQLDCSRALCLACADLGNACSEVGLRDVDFQNSQFQLDEDMRKQLDVAVAQALESLENKLTPFGELDKMIMSRNKLKLDFDHYTRKVCIVREEVIGRGRGLSLGLGFGEFGERVRVLPGFGRWAGGRCGNGMCAKQPSKKLERFGPYVA